MKSQTLNTKSVISPMDRNALILHEQLALKRLRALQNQMRRKRNWSLLWRMPLAVLAALFKRSELAREVAPYQNPAQWHEVERLRHMRAMQML